MTFLEFKQYFEDCAKSNRQLKHQSAPGYNSFAQMDIEEIMTNQNSGFNGMGMVLENPNYQIGDLLSDNYRDITSGAFLIVKEFAKGDFKDRDEVKDATLKVAKQVIAKIKNDYMHRKHNRNYQYDIMGVDMASIRINPVFGLFGGFWIGWRVAFTMNNKDATGLILNEADWFNDKKFTI